MTPDPAWIHRRLGLFADPDDARIVPETHHLGRCRYTPGTDVFLEGEPATHIFVVVTGALRLYKLLADGRRQVTGFVFEGDVLGAVLGDAYQYTAEAIGPSELARVPRVRIERLLGRHPVLAAELLSLASAELATAQNQMLLLGRKSARERLASFLLWFAGRQGDGVAPDRLHLPMSRIDIADYLGLSVETVSRTFSALRAARLIETPDHHSVALLDGAGLAALANGGPVAARRPRVA